MLIPYKKPRKSKTNTDVLKSVCALLFFLCSLALFLISLFLNRGYFNALSLENIYLYQTKQVLSILLLFAIGYAFMKTIQHKLNGLWVCILSFPSAICLWCFMSQFLLLADFTYRFWRVLFLMTVFILLCALIRFSRKIPFRRPELSVLPAFSVIVGAAFLVSTGFNYIILNYDSYFYFSDYGKALALMMSYKDIVSDNSFVMTNIGQFLPLVASYATFWGLDTMIPLQGFMILNLLVAYAVFIYGYAKEAFPAKKSVLYTALFTLLLISCSAFLLFTNWILSNAWILFYLFFLFCLGFDSLCSYTETTCSKPDSPFLGVDTSLLICGFSGAVTMLRKDGIVFVCFLFICYSLYMPTQSAGHKKAWIRDSLIPCLLFLPSAAYQLFYIYYLRNIIYARTTLAYGTSLLSDNFMKMLLLGIAATILYLALLHMPVQKIFKKYLPHTATGFLVLVLIALCLKDISRFIDYTDTWLRNLSGTAFGYSIFGILLLFCLIFLTKPAFDYPLFVTIGYILVTLIIYWNKGNTETNVDNSGLRALYQILPVCFCTAAIHCRELFLPESVVPGSDISTAQTPGEAAISDRNPLRILIVHNAYKIPGGEDSAVKNETAMLRKAGCHVVTYLRSNTELDSYSFWKKLLLPVRSVYSRKTFREVCRLIREESIEIVHVHNTLTMISPSVYYAALACRVPVVQTVHNFRLICPNALLLRDGYICTDCITRGLSESVRHACYRNSKMQTLVNSSILRYHRFRDIYNKISYICLTEFNRQTLLSINHLSEKKKEYIRPDSVYIKPNFTSDPGTPIPYEKRKKQFLLVSRLDSYKGIFVLLDAWKQYESTLIPNAGKYDSSYAELYLCGCGPEENSVCSYIADNRLNHVHFLGQIPHEEVIALMRSSLAVCLPTQCYEGFPLTIAESYACGTPVIGTDLGNVGNLINHGETGLKHPPGESKTLAEYFIHWDDNYQQAAASMSLNARAVYEQNYTEETNLTQLLSIYNTILQKEPYN